MREIIITSIIGLTSVVLATACTTTKIVEVTPTGTATFTSQERSYVQSLATQLARPTDTAIPPTETPAPPTATPVVVYVPAAAAPTVPPPPPPPPAPSAPPMADGTVSQQNALKKAKEYLEFESFSRSGLIHQLEFEGFSTEDATWGVDHLSVDWNEQAAKKAKEYLQFESFSRAGLIQQLEFEGFTPAQAEYGVSQTGL